MENETKHIEIDGISYDADRVTHDGRGFIELRQPGGHPVGRIDYHGPEVPLTVSTFGAPLPRPAMEWLMERADHALA